MNKDIIKKLLESSLPEDNILGLELQYQELKHGYTNWYKREKYNREFRKRIALYQGYTDIVDNNYTQAFIGVHVNNLRVADWFKARLEEDFKETTL